jgi:hypothetical protein
VASAHRARFDMRWGEDWKECRLGEILGVGLSWIAEVCATQNQGEKIASSKTARGVVGGGEKILSAG